MNSSSLYLKTSPLKLFFTAAIPGAISMLAGSLYGLFDGIFIGRILGETAFAAINLAFPFVAINFSLADLIGVGSSVPISIYLGKKDSKEANIYFTCACIMIVLTGILMGTFLYMAAPWLLGLMGAEGELEALAIRYVRVYALFSPVTTIVFAVDNFLRICGKIKTSMMLNIVMSVVTVVLEFVFLSVLDMGIGGAALAACSVMFAGALFALYPFFRGKLQLRFCRPKFSLKRIRQIISSGSPTFLSNMAGRIMAIVLNTILLRMGGQDAVSVYGVLMYVADVFQPILYGICDSLQPAIGYNYGAGQFHRVKSIERCCLTASGIVSVGAALAMLLFPREITTLFIKDGAEHFMLMSAQALQIFCFTYVTRWFGFGIQSYLIALDKPVPASLLSVSNAFVFPLVLIALLWPLGLNGIWLNFPVTSALVSLMAAVILLCIRKQMFSGQDGPKGEA